MLKTDETDTFTLNKQNFTKLLKTIYRGSVPPVLMEDYMDVLWENTCNGGIGGIGGRGGIRGQGHANSIDIVRFTEVLSSFDLHSLMSLNF